MDCGPPGSSVHGFSRQEYWSELLYPPPGDLPNPKIKPVSLGAVGGGGQLAISMPLNVPQALRQVIPSHHDT